MFKTYTFKFADDKAHEDASWLAENHFHSIYYDVLAYGRLIVFDDEGASVKFHQILVDNNIQFEYY